MTSGKVIEAGHSPEDQDDPAPSQFTHEVEGLNLIRSLLPANAPFRACVSGLYVARTEAGQAVDALAGQSLRIPLDAIFETVFVANAICLIAGAQQFAFNITFVTAGS